MKVPEPRRMTSGNYFIQLRLGGQSIPVTAATKTECIHQAQLIKAEHKAGKKLDIKQPAELTLKEACEKYIIKYQKVLSPSTVRGYKAYKENRFKAYQHEKITEINWQKMINDELMQQISEKTVKNGWGLVHAALKEAKYPIPEVKLSVVPVNEIAFLQPEEILPFCKVLNGRSYEIPALLELHGLRLSEMLALKWENIDLDKMLMTVRGARVRGPDGVVNKQTNKNRTSSRTVPIMIPQLVDALKAVPNKKGNVAKINPSTLLDDVKRACGYAGVTVVTNHGLRHSFASLVYDLQSKGAPISERQLMQWGGWADIHTMHKIYIRLAAKTETEAAAAVRNFFDEKPKNAN